MIAFKGISYVDSWDINTIVFNVCVVCYWILPKQLRLADVTEDACKLKMNAD